MQSPSLLDTLALLGPLSAAVVALLIALVIEPLKNFIRRPRISIQFAQGDPYCHPSLVSTVVYPDGSKTTFTKPRAAYYVRAWVENVRTWGVLGGSLARGCKGKLAVVRDGDRQRRFDYDPMILHWVSEPRTGPNPYGPVELAFGEGDYLDIMRTIEGHDQIHIDTEPELKGSPHHLGSGQHYLTVTIYGENFGPKSFHLHVNWDGKKWNELKIHQVDKV
jgi:hypothetical protein